MNRLFGTDGIRAIAGKFPLDYASVYILGYSLISLLHEEGFPLIVLVGRDTRESGPWLEQALFHGIKDAKGTAVSLGVIPTSAVSFLTRKHSFSAGIVVSASHNPYEDNGIKIFSSQGIKISDVWEDKLEKAITSSRKTVGIKATKILPSSSFVEDYSDFLRSRLSGLTLPHKIKVVLDCSNGASCFIAPRVLSDLGFEVMATCASPDGKNINARCGSLYPQNLAMKVLEEKADIGIAYDGDADRALWVDEKGRILNGDHTLYVLSHFMKKRGRLKSDYVVATTMSNLGLERALDKMHLKLFRTEVGDKYVLDQMMKLKANLGGEQSGHTIFLDDCPTGDGILTSLKMLEVMAMCKTSLSELVADFKEFPQVLLNVRVTRKVNFNRFPEIVRKIEETKDRLGNSSRMNVRFSGTEPLARIMIEGSNREEIEGHAQQLAEVIVKYLG